MLRRLNSIVLAGSAIALIVCFWNRNAIPAGIAFQPALDAEPVQRKISKRPFTVDYNGVSYRVEPEYDYELFGLVVSYRQHDGESLMHRLSRDKLNMADVCVVWSDTAFSEHLGELDFWNGVFTCNVKTRDPVAWAAFDIHELSNNHLISADPYIRARVGDVRVGDQIRIAGWLSNYGAIPEGATNPDRIALRKTSITREDSGNGACETIFVNEFDIVAPAHSIWRIGLATAAAALLATIVIHFLLPYRPYRDG